MPMTKEKAPGLAARGLDQNNKYEADSTCANTPTQAPLGGFLSPSSERPEASNDLHGPGVAELPHARPGASVHARTLNDGAASRSCPAKKLAPTAFDPIDQFRDAMIAAGITPPTDIVGDGAMHRFSTNGKHADRAGFYVLHLDGVPAGIFGDWRERAEHKWRGTGSAVMTPTERAAYREQLNAMRAQRDAERTETQRAAAMTAEDRWRAASPAQDHPYLARKHVQAHGTRVEGSLLLVPVRDMNGAICTLRTITPEGDKRFHKGGRTKGCCYVIGDVDDAVVVAEGFATAASIHEATGLAAVAAFGRTNLLAVAQGLRQRYPTAKIILAADDDYKTDGNPGLTDATRAAGAVQGFLAVPVFADGRGDKDTDFNDLAVRAGFAEVKAQIEAAKPIQPSPPFPDDDKRPAYVVLDDWREWQGRKCRPGVYYCGMTQPRSGEPTPFDVWICTPLHVEAVTTDAQGNNFGRLLRFRNSLGHWRQWAMPMELLRGSGDELRGELLAMGVEIDPKGGRTYLPMYLQHQTPKRRMRCALQVGWSGGAFVLPDTVIGPAAEDVIFQSGERGSDEYTRAGTLEEWCAQVAAKAPGNPLLLLAISAAFTGPMLQRSNAEGGGVHFVGESSTGKTTGIEAACSVWGGVGYRRSWRATANGLEGAGTLFNDGLLALDEISECDPRQVGEIVYMIGNGRGKQRASRSGAARTVSRWRCIVLSSGERTIETTMREGGYRMKAGQSVRLLSIPVARKYGAWDDLHGAQSAAAFSDALKRAASQQHGTAGRAFLEHLTRDPRDMCELLEGFKDRELFSATEGQDKRAAARFALIGLSGELATEYGITGWSEGDAINAAATAYRLWLGLRGRGNDERRQIAQQVSEFLERHGDGRFSDVQAHNDVAVRDRAGWWEDGADGRVYLMNAAGMREALAGFDFKRALGLLEEIGALPPSGANGERATLIRIGGRRVRAYRIHPGKLAEVAHDD